MIGIETDTLHECEEIPAYEDIGCGVYTSCLGCPLPKCAEDVGVNEAIQIAWREGIDLPSFRTQYTGYPNDIPPGLLRDEFIWARTNPHRMTAKQKEEIKRRLRAGMTYEAILFELPISRSSVTAMVQEMKKEEKYVPRKPGRKTLSKAGLPQQAGSLPVLQGSS